MKRPPWYPPTACSTSWTKPFAARRRRGRHLAPLLLGLSLSLAPLAQADTLPTSLTQTLEAVVEAPRSAEAIWAARQWVTRMEPRLARFIGDADLRRRLLERVYHEAALAGLPPALVMAVIQVESAFEAEAVSHAGARGLMQVMPFWVDELGRAQDDLLDPWLNLRYGCTILAHYLDAEHGDVTRALVRYNGSHGETWYPERVMRAWLGRWHIPGPDNLPRDTAQR
ncbi:transglycosylase SLT domain-containing protein [Halomonas pacifica]|uniref:Transglycosylase SLT domain-containing protein n=1 Tax=Bisbaumannia pacifica TaxID=77098 RepID=A0ABD4L2T9_9GAMM|nr:transglycosylase SLT domain-containing protein [Halomonas pacifica]